MDIDQMTVNQKSDALSAQEITRTTNAKLKIKTLKNEQSSARTVEKDTLPLTRAVVSIRKPGKLNEFKQ
jgi:hypothetical protein